MFSSTSLASSIYQAGNGGHEFNDEGCHRITPYCLCELNDCLSRLKRFFMSVLNLYVDDMYWAILFTSFTE